MTRWNQRADLGQLLGVRGRSRKVTRSPKLLRTGCQWKALPAER